MATVLDLSARTPLYPRQREKTGGNSIIFLLIFVSCAVCFALGALSVAIPFRSLKQKTLKLIKKSSFWPAPSIRVKQGGVISQLTYYIEQTQELIKNQSDQALFLRKKISVLVSQIKEALLILDESGQVLFHNPQSRELFYLEDSLSHLSQSAEKSSEALHLPLENESLLLPSEPANLKHIDEITRSPDVINIFEQCLEKEKIIVKECVFRKKNRYLESNFQVTATPVAHKGMKAKNVILLFYDQTDVKESRRAHIDFVSNVSHELKTPLTSLQGYVEMLIHDFSQKKLDQFESFLKILLKNCKRMGHLVDDLLSLSSLSSQSYLEKKRLSTKDITNQVIARINPGGRALHYFFSAPFVMANPSWVEVVLYNLIDNACRHTPSKCDIYIRWEKMRDRVVLKIIDTGEGVPEKYRQRIFERFFRVDPARSREKGGTGVGLALVRQSMEKQGGCVRVVPGSKGGMEFICEFPNA